VAGTRDGTRVRKVIVNAGGHLTLRGDYRRRGVVLVSPHRRLRQKQSTRVYKIRILNEEMIRVEGRWSFAPDRGRNRAS